MTRFRIPLAASLLSLAATPLWAGHHEMKTVEAAVETVHAFASIPLRGIPRSLLHDAAGVAVLPNVIRAGLLIDGRFGRGVVLVHQFDGSWSNPVFATLSGGGLGGEAGIESTDLVLVFKTRKSLDRALEGKLVLGGDVTLAAGPLGREAEMAGDRTLKTEIYTYSRSRGLFAGISLEGAHLRVDTGANAAFYGLPGGRAEDVLAFRGPLYAGVAALKEQLAWLSTPPAPPPPGPYTGRRPPPPGPGRPPALVPVPSPPGP
jgi:lipid-binding SYLF domain-containing protein